jgi:hypothetical protein
VEQTNLCDLDTYLAQMNMFCISFPSWSLSNSGGNAYLLAANFINQGYMACFNPETTTQFYNPTALFTFYGHELQSVSINGNTMTVYTVSNGIYTFDGPSGTISKENY